MTLCETKLGATPPLLDLALTAFLLSTLWVLRVQCLPQTPLIALCCLPGQFELAAVCVCVQLFSCVAWLSFVS